MLGSNMYAQSSCYTKPTTTVITKMFIISGVHGYLMAVPSEARAQEFTTIFALKD